MVSDKEIKASNALINDTTCLRIAVFVGGTSGIGKYTIEALVATGASMRVYLVGRQSAEERSKAFIQNMRNINPRAEVVWVEAEVSLLAETKRVCEEIKAREARVDLLFMTAGYAPFGGRHETSEGLEIVQSLEYYSRTLFVLHLLPLLAAAKGRVVSVLGGGLERLGSIDLDDLDLRKPGNFSVVKARPLYIIMNTATLDKLAAENQDITFIHSWPGWVSTGNARRGLDGAGTLLTWVVRFLLEPLIALFSINRGVSGQRHLFQSTSAAFGGNGVSWGGKAGVNTRGEATGGLFLVNFKNNCTPNLKVIGALREEAQGKIWEHTEEVLGPYL